MSSGKLLDTFNTNYNYTLKNKYIIKLLDTMKDNFEIKDSDMAMILRYIFIGAIILAVVKSCSSSVSDYSADDDIVQFESQFR